VYFDDGGWAGVIGRMSGLNGNICQCYYLRLNPAGAWGLYATTSSGLGNVLASGQVTLANTWHNLKLRFLGTTITGFVEGNQVCSITDSTYANGMVGFITGDLTNYNTAMFDNLLVNTVGGAVPQPTVFAQDITPPYGIIPPPTNDAFTNAIVVPAGGASYQANNQSATLEPGEPEHDGDPSVAASLWWAWTPATSTNVLMDTTGSVVDNVLAVYTGSSLVSLQPVTATESDLGLFQPAQVSFSAQAGTTYYIAVASANSNSVGSLVLTVAPTAFASVSGLTATVVNSQVQLQWNAYAGATSYNVKRALVSGGPYTTIASNLNTTSFTDIAVNTCQSYYYVVTMMTGGVESVPSSEAGVTLPAGVLPPQFTNADIGAVGLAGSASFCGGQFIISGSGADIWNTADAFQFVYAPLNGNGQITARVDSVQETDPWAKAGVMIRETLNAGSTHAFALISAGSGSALQYRTSTSGSSLNSGGPSVTAPYWVRLTRTGNSFAAYTSPDGTTWTQIGQSVVINMASSVYAGLAVTAHYNTLLCTSLFDDVTASFITNLPPIINWIVPTNNSTFIQPKTITLTASATDADGTVTNVAFFNGTNLLGNVTNGGGSQYSLTWNNAAVGSYTLSARATDNLGATNNFPATIAIVVKPLTLTVSGTQTNGQFRLTFQGQNGQNYVLETSTNLTAGWTPVWTNAPANGVLTFTNLNATDRSRFYRVRQ
jgi:hypothetical protein